MAAPFICNTRSAASTQFKKSWASGEAKAKIEKPVFEKESEFALARKMMFFPMVILEAQKHNSPHLIAVYLEELAQLFNHFYNEISIIGTEG